LGIANAKTVSLGAQHSCALLEDGSIACWGSNTFGQLGRLQADASVTAATPEPVHGIRSATSLAAGAAHTCASLADGSVACWGANNAGQLGTGTLTPVEVLGL
jgi:alpha-tubulin suppressor-like RCC1 family protein